jgi:hypothetical protein
MEGGVALTPYIRIRDGPGWNLVSDASYPEVLLTVPPEEYLCNATTGSFHIPSNSSFMYHSIYLALGSSTSDNAVQYSTKWRRV